MIRAYQLILIKERANRGCTIKELADLISEPQEYIESIENGQISPTAECLIKIAEAYHVSVDHLLGRTHECAIQVGNLTVEQRNTIETIIKEFEKANGKQQPSKVIDGKYEKQPNNEDEQNLYLHQTELPTAIVKQLSSLGIETVSQLILLERSDIRKLRNIGKKRAQVIGSFIEEMRKKEYWANYVNKAKPPQPKQTRRKYIECLPLSQRAINSLVKNGYTKKSQFFGLDKNQLMKIRNLGKVTVDEILSLQKKLLEEKK